MKDLEIYDHVDFIVTGMLYCHECSQRIDTESDTEESCFQYLLELAREDGWFLKGDKIICNFCSEPKVSSNCEDFLVNPCGYYSRLQLEEVGKVIAVLDSSDTITIHHIMEAFVYLETKDRPGSLTDRFAAITKGLNGQL